MVSNICQQCFCAFKGVPFFITFVIVRELVLRSGMFCNCRRELVLRSGMFCNCRRELVLRSGMFCNCRGELV